jgi:hypothetical protein
MARAITANELVKLRRDGQHSRLYLAIHQPAVIFRAQVNQTFSTTDKVIEITYDGADGDYTDILVGQTVWIGTSEGGLDRGRARIRKTPTDTIIYIGETSEIAWEEDLYLTVVDEFGLWPKHLYIATDGTVYMDQDVAYTDQHTDQDPVPVMGPPAVKYYQGTLGGANTVTLDFDAGDSWVLAGAAITGYSWAAPLAASIVDGNTSTPEITYDAPGTYRVACTVTADNGKSTTGYRAVMIYDDTQAPITAFELLDCGGSADRGGWDFGVRMSDDAGVVGLTDPDIPYPGPGRLVLPRVHERRRIR